MKTVITFLVACSTLFALSMAVQSSAETTHCPVPKVAESTTHKSLAAPNGTTDLNSVIASVEAALKCYQDNRGTGPDALPPLQQATFDFKTTTGTVGGVTISFFIFKVGASKESDMTNQLTFTYSVPKPATGNGHALKLAKPPQYLSDSIVADIQSAAEAVKSRATVDKLAFSKLALTLQYGVVFDGNIGINAPIQLVTLGANIDKKRNDVQSVTLTFGAGE